MKLLQKFKKEGKKVLLSVNTGVTLLYTSPSLYNTQISNQANPIQNINIAFCINPQHRITMDLSMSTYQSTSFDKYGESKNNGLRLTFEIGYSHRFKQKGEVTNKKNN